LCSGLIVRRGQRTWKVLGNAKDKENGAFVEYVNFGDVPESITSIKSTMFPVDVVEGIENTIKVFPHDQNTGGFFIGLFKKRSGIVREVVVEGDVEDVPVENPEKPKKKRKILDVEQPLYVPLESHEDKENIASVFGIEAHPMELLLTPLTKNFKNLFFVSPEAKEFLDKEETKKLKILNVGVCAFTKNKHGPSKAVSKYRPHQNALPFISKFITKNRVFTENITLLKDLLKNSGFETEAYRDLGLGYYVMKFLTINEEVLVLKVAETKFQTVIPREHIDSLYIRYPDLSL